MNPTATEAPASVEARMNQGIFQKLKDLASSKDTEAQVREFGIYAEGNFTEHKGGQSPDLERRYPDRFFKNHAGYKLEIQLAATIPSENPQDNINGSPVLMRVWQVNKDNSSTSCYYLAKDGNWYMREATKYSHDQATNTDLWSLGDIKLASETQRDELFTLLDDASKK